MGRFFMPGEGDNISGFIKSQTMQACHLLNARGNRVFAQEGYGAVPGGHYQGQGVPEAPAGIIQAGQGPEKDDIKIFHME